MNNNLVSMSHVFYRALRAVFSSKNVRLSLPCLLLAGCVTHAPKSAISHKQEDKWPQKQSLSGHDVESNPLFWLRGIDCAQRLAPAEARAQAAMLVDDTWQDAFKRGIVMADARITPVERRANVTRLDTYVINIPSQVRPVYQLWRDGQTLQLQLSEERFRYSKLQQSSDSELDALRQQQESLREQLDTTTRKLENLTDIERQLSTRKPAGSYLPDGSKGNSATTPDGETPKQEDVKP